jgi:hypothetical protein
VVYVDNDPVVISHASALLPGSGSVAAFVRALVPGSFLSISVGINDDAALADQVTTAYTAGEPHVHDRAQIAGYFAGLELVQPGLTEARNWLLEGPDKAVPGRPADLLAGIGRKAP